MEVADTWIVYGGFDEEVDGKQVLWKVFSSKRLVLKPGVRYTLQDPVGSDLIVVKGCGKVGSHTAFAPRALTPGEESNWTFIIPHAKASEVIIENTGESEMVMLRTFGSDHPEMPVLPWQDASLLQPKRKTE